jgi:hypothetical protein
MTDVHSFDVRLKELGEKATDRLLMAEVFDESAFSELYVYCLELAEKLADEYVVSKQFLAVLIGTSQAIRSRAEYLPKVRPHLKVANDFDSLLAIVAAGESPRDRRPGVPRIL